MNYGALKLLSAAIVGLASCGVSQPTAAQQPAPAAPAVPTALDYVLGELDLVEVSVVGLPELTTRTRIGEDGTITLPLIGAIRVGGLDVPQAARLIAAHYAGGGYAANPSVRIEIIEFQSRKVSVLGLVNAQGMVALDRAYSLAEVLARAGGLKDEAADSVVIVRQAGKGFSERLTVDLTKMADGTGAPVPVRPGDVIYVPKAPTFSVLGAVNRAGTYRLAAGTTVQEALAAAGDVARIGTRSRLRIRRAGEKGVVEVIPAKLDTPVRPGDTILVRERIF